MTQQQAFYSGKLGKADLHMHSTYSDGMATIEQILHHVQHNTDLDVIALDRSRRDRGVTTSTGPLVTRQLPF